MVGSDTQAELQLSYVDTIAMVLGCVVFWGGCMRACHSTFLFLGVGVERAVRRGKRGSGVFTATQQYREIPGNQRSI